MEGQVVRRRPVVTSNTEILDEHIERDIPEEIKQDRYKKAQDELMEFVAQQIELMKSQLLFSGKSEPGLYELNQSLMNFEAVMLGLITIHAEVRTKLDIAKEEYDNFYAQKYVEVKQAQQSLGKSAMFTAQREIELYVRNNYLSEIAAHKAEIIKIENQYNTVNYLIDSWKNYSFVLNQLGANSRAEAQAANIAFNNSKEFGDENLGDVR
jgi:hypothetical protein